MDSRLVIRQEGNEVTILFNGKFLSRMPWDKALAFSTAVRIQALRAEEVDKAQLIVADQALLTRHGIPIGLSNNPKINAEAFRESQHLPGPAGICPTSVVGTPTILRGK